MSPTTDPNKTVVIAGGSGFLGTKLTSALTPLGYAVVILTRSPETRNDGAVEVGWDGQTLGPWAEHVNGARALVNFAGSSIDVRRTPENDARVLSSRVDSTHVLGQAVSAALVPPPVWIQTSAVGFYGDTGDTVCTESSPAGSDFHAGVVVAWEKAFAESCPGDLRRVVFRVGVVLDQDTGALKKLADLTRWGLGGAAGSGQQFLSWVHVDDVIAAYMRAISGEELKGVYNLCSPNPTRNAEFMKALRNTMNRPWSPPVPSFAVRIGGTILGSPPELALKGQRCSPEALTRTGFSFRYPHLSDALGSLLS